jgi:hypothetical protein
MAKEIEKTKNEDKPFAITHALADASNTFSKAVNAFNSQNGTELGKWLDQEVVLFRKRNGGVIKQGHDQVLAALEGLFTNNGSGPASFTPLSTNFRPVAWPVIARGSAAWHDNDGSPDDTIKYEFTFNPSNSLILSLWAQHK